MRLGEGRRDRKKRERREQIYQAAQQLFVRNGIEATTVEQIAEEADVSQATVFNYFPSKDAIVHQMTGEVSEYLRAILARELSRPIKTEERVAAFADAVAREIGRVRGLTHEVLQELFRTSGPVGGAIPYLAQAHELFTAMLREGQERGEVRLDRDPIFLAEVVVGVLHAAVINWINDPAYPLEMRIRQIAAFIGEAIRPAGAAPRPKDERHG